MKGTRGEREREGGFRLGFFLFFFWGGEESMGMLCFSNGRKEWRRGGERQSVCV